LATKTRYPSWRTPRKPFHSRAQSKSSAKDCPKPPHQVEALYLTTVDELKRHSGVDSFWQLPNAEEGAMEAAKDLAWAQSWAG
jgi:hypothetical protein